MDLRQCIAELLTLHDCVIIPDFGGFIGHASPARIDLATHTFYPPSKKLLFNVSLKHNDGLLASRFAAVQNIPYAEAMKEIASFSAACRQTLRMGSEVIIPGAGRLRSGDESTIQFDQDCSFSLLSEAYGLGAVASRPVMRITEPAAEAMETDTEQDKGRRRALPALLRYAAMLALPVGIAATLWITQGERLANGFDSNAGFLTSLFERYSAASLDPKRDAPARVKPDPVRVILPVASVAKAPVQAVADQRFAVIVGAFRQEENAGKLIRLLQVKGFNASLFDRSRTGLFRVAIGTASDRDAALQLLETARAGEFPGAWLLSK